jgi:hypothetical protein
MQNRQQLAAMLRTGTGLKLEAVRRRRSRFLCQVERGELVLKWLPRTPRTFAATPCGLRGAVDRLLMSRYSPTPRSCSSFIVVRSCSSERPKRSIAHTMATSNLPAGAPFRSAWSPGRGRRHRTGVARHLGGQGGASVPGWGVVGVALVLG